MILTAIATYDRFVASNKHFLRPRNGAGDDDNARIVPSNRTLEGRKG